MLPCAEYRVHFMELANVSKVSNACKNKMVLGVVQGHEEKLPTRLWGGLILVNAAWDVASIRVLAEVYIF